MNISRFVEITEQINALLALPMPIPAEKHLLREQIFALKFEQLGLSGDLPPTEQDQLARDFTLHHVPQYLHSYPMAKRETCMPVNRESMRDITRPAPGQIYGNYPPGERKLPPARQAD